MLICEKRLRKLICEEVTSAIQGDDNIVVSRGGSCFETSRRRYVPAGRLRTTPDAAAGLAMDLIMTAIMRHQSLADIATTDMDWEVISEEWDDANEYITVLGRGCFKDCSKVGTIAFRRYCLSLEDDEDSSEEAPPDIDYIEPIATPDTGDTADTGDTGDTADTGDTGDTGEDSLDFKPVLDPDRIEIEDTIIEAGDGLSMTIGSMDIEVEEDGNLLVDNTSYSVAIETRVFAVLMTIEVEVVSIKNENDGTITVQGIISENDANLRKPPDKGNRSIVQNIETSMLIEKEESFKEKNEKIEFGPFVIGTGRNPRQGMLVFSL